MLKSLRLQGKGIHMHTFTELLSRYSQKAFPGSPEFADYLSKRVLAINGSLETARLLIATLKRYECHHQSHVSPETVTRLCVDHDPLVSLRSVVCSVPHVAQTIVAAATEFRWLLMYKIVVPDGAIHPRDFLYFPRTAVEEQDVEALMRLFYCTYAMLAGVEVDPRAEAA